MNEIILLLLGSCGGLFHCLQCRARCSWKNDRRSFPWEMRQHAHEALQARLRSTKIAVVLFWALFIPGAWAVLQEGIIIDNCRNYPHLRDLPVHVHRTGILICSAQCHEGAEEGPVIPQCGWTLTFPLRDMVLPATGVPVVRSTAAKKPVSDILVTRTAEKITKEKLSEYLF